MLGGFGNYMDSIINISLNTLFWKVGESES